MLLGSLMSGQTKPNIRVGNFLVTAPNGVSVIYDDRSAFVLDFGGDYVAGIAAPDDSYHAQHLTLNGVDINLEWGRAGSGAVGRVTSAQSATVKLRFRGDLWPGFKTDYLVRGRDVIVNLSPTRSGK